MLNLSKYNQLVLNINKKGKTWNGISNPGAEGANHSRYIIYYKDLRHSNIFHCTKFYCFFLKSWISERLKNSIKHEYDQKLETYQSQLKSQSEIELEKLRSTLSIETVKSNVKFSYLLEKRANVLGKIYSILDEVLIT